MPAADVTVWAPIVGDQDISGTLHTWSTSGGNDPAWDATGWSDGTAQVTFDTGELMTCTTMDDSETSDDWTLLCLMDQTDAATGQMFAMELGGNAAFAMSTAGTPSDEMAWFNVAYVKSGTAIDTGEQIRAWRVDGSGAAKVDFWKNKTKFTQGDISTYPTIAMATNQYLMQYASLATNRAQVKAVLLFRKALTDDEVEVARKALAIYGGLE